MSNPYLNFFAVLDEFSKATDRAAAIVGGAFLDEVLMDLLKTYFAPDEKSDKKIFSGNGFLSTFSARIDLCYRLGLISHSEYKNLHTIRDIRNKFAHQLQELSFERQDIKDLSANIQVPESLLLPNELGEIEKADIGKPRQVFEESVISHIFQIEARMAQAILKRSKVPARFTSSAEVVKCIVGTIETQNAVLAEMQRLLGQPPSEEDGSSEREIMKTLHDLIRRLESSEASSKEGKGPEEQE